jgi:hypothetical protein
MKAVHTREQFQIVQRGLEGTVFHEPIRVSRWKNCDMKKVVIVFAETSEANASFLEPITLVQVSKCKLPKPVKASRQYGKALLNDFYI